MALRARVGVILAAVVAILSSAAVRADVLVRVDGLPIEGKLISQTASQIVFQPDRGNPLTFDRNVVQRVLTLDAKGALLTDSSAATQPAARWNVPPEPAAPPIAARGAKPTYYVIPLHGEVGVTVLASALDKSLADAVARKASVVVLDIDSPGGLVEEAKKIMEVLHKYNKQTRIVALANQDLSAAAILSLSCKEIYVKATGTIGAAVAYNPANLTLPPKLEEKMQSAWRAVARNSAEEGGHEPLLAEAMIDNTLELHLETVGGRTVVKEGVGDRTICKMGKILTLSSHEAVECGLAAGPADDFAELGKALSLANWTECKGLAGPLADYLPQRAAAFKTALEEIQIRFGQNVRDAVNADPSRTRVTVLTSPAPRPIPTRHYPGQIPRPQIGPPAGGQTVRVVSNGSPATWKKDSLLCVMALNAAEADLRQARSLCEAFGQLGQAEEVQGAQSQIGAIRAEVFEGRNKYAYADTSVATTRPTGTDDGLTRVGRANAAARAAQRAAERARNAGRLTATLPANAEKTAIVGGPGGGTEFIKASPSAAAVLGFRVTFGSWAGRQVLRQVDPLFDSTAPAQADAPVVMARDGYVVSGLIVSADKVNAFAFRVIFAQVKNGRADPVSTYTSDWIGKPQGDTTQQLAGKGETAVGLCGHQGMNCDALGLVIVPPGTAVAMSSAAGTATPGAATGQPVVAPPLPAASNAAGSATPGAAPAQPVVAPPPPAPGIPSEVPLSAEPNHPGTPSVVEVPGTPPTNPTITARTPMVGAITSGHDFERISRDNAPLVGFGVMYGMEGGKHPIRLIFPISDRPRDVPRDTFVARDGYAVAGLLVNTDHEFVMAFRVIYARVIGSLIDPTSTYMSEWIGTPENDQTTTQLAGKGETVVGIYGREKLNCHALGLVVVPAEVAMDAHRSARAAASGNTAPPKAGPFPVPDASSQARALKMIQEVHAPYPPTDRIARDDLAATLLDEGLHVTDDPAQRYVLLRESRDMSMQSGDWGTTMAAINALSETFSLDAIANRTAALNQAAKTAQAQPSRRLIAAAIAAAESAIAADRYEDASRGAYLADFWARQAGDDADVATVQPILVRARGGQRDYAAFTDAMRLLKTHPADPAASLTAGKFKCFCKGDWAGGLPMLAECSDPGLKAAAVAELATPRTKDARVALANEWWELSDKMTDAVHPLQARAVYWYEQALPEVTSPLEKALLEKRIAAAGPIDASMPALSTQPAIALSELRLNEEIAALHGGAVNCMAVTPDGKMMITAGDSRIIRVWDLSQRPPREISHVDGAHASGILGMSLSPDGKLLATGGWDKNVKLWKVDHGQLKTWTSLDAHLSDVRAMTFSANSKMLVTGGNDGMIFGWDCSGSSPAQIMSFRAGMNGLGVSAVAISPDGRTVALATNGSLLALWDISARPPVERFHLMGHAGFIHTVAFSPDGQMLASGGGDKTVRLWTLSGSPRIFKVLQAHSDEVNSIRFSADGRLMATAGSLGDLFIWDAHAGTQLIRTQKAADLRGLAFYRADAAARGEYELAAGSADGNAYLFRLGGKHSP